MKIKGIDVSKHQGKIDFSKVKNDGIEFVIIRIGYGGSAPVKDENFEENYKNAKANGLKVGVYLYSYADTDSDIEIELKKTIEWLGNRDLDLPVYLDVEDSKEQGKLSKDTLTNLVFKYCEGIEKTGYWCGIYASKSWLDSKLDMNKLSRFTVWVAQWSDKVSYKGTYAMWQYSSNGNVSGISGRVDMNYQVSALGGNTEKTDETKENNQVNTEYTGNSIVDYLKSIGIDSSFENRKNLAIKYGIINYSGRSDQNLQLLKNMRGF